MRSRFRTPPPEASYQRQADVPRLGRVYVATPGVGPRVLSARALVSRSASVRPSRLSRSPKLSGAHPPNRATRATIALPESDRPDGREPAMPLPRKGAPASRGLDACFRVEARAETPPRRHRDQRHRRTIPPARALRRKAGVRISAAPSSPSLVLAPRSKRARARRGTTGLTLAPARAGLLQRHDRDR